jgi:hypothetical protein
MEKQKELCVTTLNSEELLTIDGGSYTLSDVFKFVNSQFALVAKFFW